MKLKFKTLAAASTMAAVAALGLAATSASAAVVDFDDLNGNPAYYENQNFLFTPVGNSSSGLCYDGRCLQELTQGQVTTMTYDASAGGPYGDGGQGGASIPLSTVAPNYGDAFNLDFFYFLLTGNGAASSNLLTVTGTFANNSTVSATFALNASTGATATGANVVFASDYDGNNNNTPDGTIQKNVGFWVDLDDRWHGIVSAKWTSGSTAQVRLDCVGANESGLGSASGCKPSTMSPVPLPAAGWMLLAGLGGMVAMRRRKKAELA